MTVTEAPRLELPTVSLRAWHGGSASERAALADEVRAICHDIGFFCLVDHGVPLDFLDRYLAALESFFAARSDQSADRQAPVAALPWLGAGRRGADRQPVDYREQIDLASEHPARALDVTPAYLRLDGPNLWLPEDVLPGFRALVEEFLAYAAELARTLMELLSVGLGLEAGPPRSGCSASVSSPSPS
ncbi:MAG: 2-oxoglutarate and iron-dependent oxygenase domain-containing protein [Ilumatobacteraceae bacterium]